jgi:hypothetical protein
MLGVQPLATQVLGVQPLATQVLGVQPLATQFLVSVRCAATRYSI